VKGANAMSDKASLREKFRQMRRENPGHDNYLFLLDVPEVSNAKVITSYYPMPGEPSLISLNDALLAAGKTVLLPRIVNKKMEFAKYEGNLIKNGKFHEPAGNIFLGEIQVCLIPATAIDKDGYRLGQGGGYYDQFLVGTSAYRIGIIHDREFVKKIPHEWFDQKVEAIATESGFRSI
jgi:5-formyltetrahydrofolate cyclo-ligase